MAVMLPLSAVFAQTSSGAPATGQTTNQATAQTPSPATPDAGAKSLQPLTVTAKKPDYRRHIDRKSYSLDADLQSANGSLADALRNIPSVNIDPRGNLTVRGGGVTILVDGEPSPLFQGPQRADILQQLPANQYERVEVITNPSAAFNPEGTGGILNLITRKSHPAGRAGSVHASGDTHGSTRASASGAYTGHRLTLNGSAGISRNASQNTTLTGSGSSIPPPARRRRWPRTHSAGRAVSR